MSAAGQASAAGRSPAWRSRSRPCALHARLLAALLLALAAPAARAWELKRAADGMPRRWASFPLKLRAAPPPPGVQVKQPFEWQAALQAALLTWQSVDSASASVRWAGRISGAIPPPGRGQVVLSFDLEGFPGGRDDAGLTELFDDPADAHAIVGARIHLNARDFTWTSGGGDGALDVQSVALHELGHALGIAHPCGDLDTGTPSCQALPLTQRQALQAAVMWPSIQAGQRRALADDDVGAIAAAAPTATSAPDPAPLLEQLVPACATKLEGLQLTLRSSRPAGADTLSIQLDGADLVLAPVVASTSTWLSAALPNTPVAVGVLPARLDALFFFFDGTSSRKAALLPGALTIADQCSQSGGCASPGAPGLLGILGALSWLRRRSRAARRPAPRIGRPPTGGRPLAALALAALLFAPAPAQAYKRSVNAGGLCTFWSTRGHTFMIDALGTPDVVGTAAFEAIRKSFRTWAAVSCSDLAFPDLGLSRDRADRRVGYVPGGFNRNLILFRTANCRGGVVPAGDACLTQGGCGNLYDCWDHDGSVLATTTTTSNRFTGQIADSDIEFNDAPSPEGSLFVFTAVDSPPCVEPTQTNCVRIDIQNTATHEIGHTIGLDHSTDPTSTMYASAPEGETAKRTLHPDDVQGVCDIYPKGAETATCLGDPITLTQTGYDDGKGCGCNAAGAGPSLQGALLAAVAFALGARRRRASC